MSVATGSSEAAGGARGGGARVFFQSPRGGSPGSSSGSGSSREDAAPVAPAAAAGQAQQQQQQRRHQQGKVTVKYDRKELRKRLVLEEWIVEQLGQLYGCQVPGRGRGPPSPGCPPGILQGSSSRARTVLTPGDPAPSRSRAASGPGEQRVGRLCLWGAAGPLVAAGDGVGLGLAKRNALLQPRGLLGSSCC